MQGLLAPGKESFSPQGAPRLAGVQTRTQTRKKSPVGMLIRADALAARGVALCNDWFKIGCIYFGRGCSWEAGTLSFFSNGDFTGSCSGYQIPFRMFFYYYFFYFFYED